MKLDLDEPEHTWGDNSSVVLFHVLLMHDLKVRRVLNNYLFTKNVKVTSVVGQSNSYLLQRKETFSSSLRSWAALILNIDLGS